MTHPYAVLAITKNGVAIARRLFTEVGGMDVYYPEKFLLGDETDLGFILYNGSVAVLISDIFHTYRGIIAIVSLGAMVRMIAPLLVDKKTDPAIVVIDDKALHVISLLSGHLGGANQLTQQIAKRLGARPVISTASDVGQTLTVDLLGREFGFEIDNFAQVTKVSAAVINGQRIHIVQEAGERHWWPQQKPLPANIRLFTTVEQALAEPFAAALIITPRLLSEKENEQLLCNGVLYRPKVVVVGVGCNRGTVADEIEQAIAQTLLQAKLSSKSVRNIATINIKGDERGLLDVCEKQGWGLETFTAAELNTIALSQPSDKVYKYVGAYGVCQPAARLSSGANDWVVEKVKTKNVTVSICIINHL